MSEYQTSDTRDNAQNRRNAVQPIIKELEKVNSKLAIATAAFIAGIVGLLFIYRRK